MLRFFILVKRGTVVSFLSLIQVKKQLVGTGWIFASNFLFYSLEFDLLIQTYDEKKVIDCICVSDFVVDSFRAKVSERLGKSTDD
ncbi:hypothetical protein NT017_28080 [Prolixibacter sp. NT017]|nr:hypothetical protein NT017_28080 [Prolixibacter sp. NT017]